IAIPITPPSASISRTRCPFAVPPIAGLQGMCAIVSIDSVQIAMSRPMRAAAHAASTPACPAPITMISWCLFPNAEPFEDDLQHFVLRACPGDLVEPAARLVQIGQDEFFRDAVTGGRPRAPDRRARLLEQRHVPQIRHRRAIAKDAPAARPEHRV